ncbi:MAG: FeoB-associated Cys-rich membrane protein [Muribaculaceae bacterium]|nr:FeoB-associated Cys-rich membrane protein [Muribaculaceae bacterium]
MLSESLQLIIVIAIVVAAVGWAVYRVFVTRKRRSGCSSCGIRDCCTMSKPTSNCEQLDSKPKS